MSVFGWLNDQLLRMTWLDDNVLSKVVPPQFFYNVLITGLMDAIALRLPQPRAGAGYGKPASADDRKLALQTAVISGCVSAHMLKWYRLHVRGS